MLDDKNTTEQLIQELAEARGQHAEPDGAILADGGSALYQTMFESAPMGMALATSTGQLLIMNRALEDVLGCSLEELNGRDPITIGGHSLEEILTSPPPTGRGHEVEIEGPPSRYFEVIARPVEIKPDLDASMLVFRETTAERALRESEEKYRQLFSNELDAISIFNPENGQILDVNDAYQKLYGYSKQEVLEMTVADVSAEPDETMTAIQNAISTSSARIMVRWHKKKDGTVFPVELYAGTFEWKGQRVMCASMRDISERMEAEQRRVELALERERVKILSKFIRDASHEFRTPLSTISTSTYLLRHTADSNRRDKHVDRIDLQINALDQLITSLMTMAKLDSDLELDFNAIDANQIVGDVVSKLRPRIEEKSLVVNLALSSENFSFQADPAWLGTALEAVIRNAIRFTPHGKTILISTGVEGSQAVVEVQDSGTGMADDVLAQIFETFYREDDARTSRGFGLGLSIARRIIELHQGRIEVDSQPDVGSSFRIRLPM